MANVQTSITVSVPATSANLGPGYDCLGVALDLRNHVRFSRQGAIITVAPGATPDTSIQTTVRLEGIDCEKLPSDESNLIVSSAEVLFRQTGRWPEGMTVELTSAIPVGSGLGSSSSAIVAGLFGANALIGAGLDDSALLEIAVSLEGHPDNVAPAILGGLVLGIMSPDGEGGVTLLTRRLPVPSLEAVVVLPTFELPTSEARAILPNEISRADAIHNASRLGLLLLALTRPELDLLPEAMDDRLHQPYRLPLIPGAEAALRAAYETGAAGVALSGAGPSLIALAPGDSDAVAAAMSRAFEDAGLPSRSWSVAISETGVLLDSE